MPIPDLAEIERRRLDGDAGTLGRRVGLGLLGRGRGLRPGKDDGSDKDGTSGENGGQIPARQQGLGNPHESTARPRPFLRPAVSRRMYASSISFS